MCESDSGGGRGGAFSRSGALLEDARCADDGLALSVEHRFGVSCTLTGHRPFARHHRNVEAHLYRITQEAVSNAVLHGRADRIEINQSSKDGKGPLSVRDNGVGLPEAKGNLERIGLHTMAYRTHLIGDSFELRRHAQRGTVASYAFRADCATLAALTMLPTVPLHRPDGLLFSHETGRWQRGLVLTTSIY